MLVAQIGNREDRYIDPAKATVKITLLVGTTHGELVRQTAGEYVAYIYESKPGYLGKDKAVFLAEFEGKRYKIVVNFVIAISIASESAMMEGDMPPCPTPQLIKLKPKPTPGSSSYDPGSATVSFAALEGGALGQTTGQAITLDTTAAGYNWFIDYTPWLNEEYLPTADTNVWQARPGSEAAGKMDMLSVLLHEYGHVLGIEHSADQHASMASTLTPGTRRLPSADELALMAQLVSDVKTGLTNTPQTPTSPIPLGTTLGGLWLARLRKSAPGETVTGTTAHTDPSATPQYSVAAHATLTNPGFTGGAGWSTTGTVTFDSTGTAAVQGSTSKRSVRCAHELCGCGIRRNG